MLHNQFLYPTRNNAKSQRGMALLIVLWTSVLLAVIAAILTRTAQTLTRDTLAASYQAEAELLADGAIHQLLYSISQDAEAEMPERTGVPTALDIDGHRVLVQLWDERGKIDLNAGNMELLSQLLQNIALDKPEADRIVARIIDYRDADSDEQPGGYEDGAYLADGRTTTAKDGPFESIEELLQIPEVNSELFAQIRDYVTVHGRNARIATSVASDKFLALTGLEAAERRRTPAPRNSSVLKIIAYAPTKNGGHAARQAIVQMTRGGRAAFKVLAWRQIQRQRPTFAVAD
jgi:general secretion pathway protein K